jgi:hypothetical protein
VAFLFGNNEGNKNDDTVIGKQKIEKRETATQAMESVVPLMLD